MLFKESSNSNRLCSQTARVSLIPSQCKYWPVTNMSGRGRIQRCVYNYGAVSLRSQWYAWVAKTITVFYATRRFITAFPASVAGPYPELDESNPYLSPIYLGSILTLFSYLRSDLPSGSSILPSVDQDSPLIYLYVLTSAIYRAKWSASYPGRLVSGGIFPSHSTLNTRRGGPLRRSLQIARYIKPQLYVSRHSLWCRHKQWTMQMGQHSCRPRIFWLRTCQFQFKFTTLADLMKCSDTLNRCDNAVHWWWHSDRITFDVRFIVFILVVLTITSVSNVVGRFMLLMLPSGFPTRTVFRFLISP
jgi:hypothetical protein